jgi:hypothetical protein
MYTPKNPGFRTLGDLGDFGIIQAVAVATAVGNVAVNAHHALKVSKLQSGFQKRLETDEEKKDYVKLVAQQFQDVGKRIARGGRFRPGTEAFELVLKRALKDEIHYKGNCNVTIFKPYRESPDKPREVLAKISKTGYVEPGAHGPKDMGPLWAGKCRASQDIFKLEHVGRYKGARKHRYLRAFREDVGTMDLFVRYGVGFIMAAVMMVMIKIQYSVVEEQKTIPRRRRKKKKKKKPKPESKRR